VDLESVACGLGPHPLDTVLPCAGLRAGGLITAPGGFARKEGFAMSEPSRAAYADKAYIEEVITELSNALDSPRDVRSEAKKPKRSTAGMIRGGASSQPKRGISTGSQSRSGALRTSFYASLTTSRKWRGVSTSTT
jgi:hypothetical protein